MYVDFNIVVIDLTLKSPGFLVPSKDRGGEDSAHNGFWPITVSIFTQIKQTWFQMKADIFTYLQTPWIFPYIAYFACKRAPKSPSLTSKKS